MASEYSLYRKIQVTLEIAKSVQIGSWSELRAEILSNRPPNFLTKRYDAEHDTVVQDISERSVKKTVAICRALQLVDETGALTSPGRQSLRKAAFDRVIAEQIHVLLEAKGVRVSLLNEIVARSLQSTPVTMPTALELWQQSAGEMSLMLFSQMLTLLAQAGGAESSQRKVYLHFGKRV